MKTDKHKVKDWLEGYRCGCSSDAKRKKDLLGYCAKHGDDRDELYYKGEKRL